MKIATIGGGASGLVAAYLLGKQGHHVTVFEKQPVLGGHIRTLNKNIQPNHAPCEHFLEGGVLEFPCAFRNFLNLMQELDVELEPVHVGSSLFLKDGRRFLSREMIAKNLAGVQRSIALFNLRTLYARAAPLWFKANRATPQTLFDRSLAQFLGSQSLGSNWVKLLTMYSYSIPFDQIDRVPAALAVPAMRDYVFVDWMRIKGGVYSYIERILDRFNGEIVLDADIASIDRSSDVVRVVLSDGRIDRFDKVIFATPPDQVLQLLADPTPNETKRFAAWRRNEATTIMHTDRSMYAKYKIQYPSEFDFFQIGNGWGYNAALNQLCGIQHKNSQQSQHSCQYSLAFNLDNVIAKDNIIHIQKHHTPLYTVEAFKYRDEIIKTNGENNTYHAGAYLGDGLHEGAIVSAMRVSQLIAQDAKRTLAVR